MRAVGAPFTLGRGAHPLIARLRQHLGFRVHPPQAGGLARSLERPCNGQRRSRQFRIQDSGFRI